VCFGVVLSSRWSCWPWRHGGFVVLVDQRTLETFALVCSVWHVCCRIVCFVVVWGGARVLSTCAPRAPETLLAALCT
jgi:hypothetical protein